MSSLLDLPPFCGWGTQHSGVKPTPFGDNENKYTSVIVILVDSSTLEKRLAQLSA